MSRLRIPRDLRELHRSALRQGWTVAITRGNHLKWCSPSGAIVFCPSTPSDSRNRDNTRLSLQRAGLRIERRG